MWYQNKYVIYAESFQNPLQFEKKTINLKSAKKMHILHIIYEIYFG